MMLLSSVPVPQHSEGFCHSEVLTFYLQIAILSLLEEFGSFLTGRMMVLEIHYVYVGINIEPRLLCVSKTMLCIPEKNTKG